MWGCPGGVRDYEQLENILPGELLCRVVQRLRLLHAPAMTDPFAVAAPVSPSPCVELIFMSFGLWVLRGHTLGLRYSYFAAPSGH